MALAVKDLCRFCAKTHSFTKELMDKDNINVFKFIKDIVHIELNEEPNLPTKMCLDCEEKVLSFQMFVLEYSRVQDTLRKMVLEEIERNNKTNEEPTEDIITLPPPLPVKAEVKDEFPLEDFAGGPYRSDSDQSFVDNVEARSDVSSPPPVKRRAYKKRKIEKKKITEEELEKFNELLNRPYVSIKDFVKLSCNMCSEEFKTWSRLRMHFSKAHKAPPVVYCICGTPLTSKTHLYKHISDHKVESKKRNKVDADENEDQDQDNEDNNDEDKYANLKVNDFVSFTCTNCGKKYSSWYKLKSHSATQHRTSPVVTCICGFSVKSKSVLYKHISDHKNPDVLSCDKCMKVTKSVQALEKHKLKHIPKEERVFKCNECEKIFNNKDGLKSHMKSHIPIQQRKIYGCNYCDLKFTTRSSAMSHRRVVHEKIKSYICDLCGYTCGTNGELKQHRAIHSDDKPHVCSTCSKSFKTYSNLKTHMDTHEDTSYECYVCRRVLNSRRTLRKHLLVHDEKCRHVCSYCNKAFKRRQTLKVHLYTHTGDKPLTCRWCEERFAYASTLRSHRLRCHPDKMANSQQPTTTNYTYKNLYDEDIVKNEGLILGYKNEIEIDMQTTLQLK